MKPILLILAASAAFAQTGALAPVPRQQPLGNGGQILAGSCMYSYAAGTSTPKNTYSDSGLTIANTNPIVLDSSGREPAVYLLASSYKFTFGQKALGVCPATPGTVIWSQDNVYDFAQLFKVALAASNGASLVGYTYQPGGGVTTVKGALDKLFTYDVTAYGAIADGTGIAGTDQSARFQAAADAAAAAGGGFVYVPPAPLCYVIGTSPVTLASNVTVYSNSQSTCVQKQFGNHPNPVFRAGEGLVGPVSNIWLKNFTIDGNKANIGGISGDGYNQGIAFAGATNSGAVDMMVKNTYTGGISVACWGAAPATGAGNNVTILNTIITASRRNNFELLCGTNTHIIGGQLSNATGGSLSLGLDVEPFAAGQLVTGLSVEGTEIFGNRDGGINISQPYDTVPFMSFVDVNCHTNGGTLCMNAINFYASAPSGSLSVVGGMYSGGTTAAVNLAGWKYASFSGATIIGGPWGLLASANNPNVVLGPGSISGTSYDIGVDGANGSHATLAGATLVCSAACVQPGATPYVTWPLVTTQDINTATANGVASWDGTAPRNGGTVFSKAVTITPSDTVNPGILVNDQSGHIAKIQVVNGSGTVFGGSQSAYPACWGANNQTVLGFCVDVTGTKPYVPGLQTFADNAAAIAGGLTTPGMLYRITGTDQLGVVH